MKGEKIVGGKLEYAISCHFLFHLDIFPHHDSDRIVYFGFDSRITVARTLAILHGLLTLSPSFRCLETVVLKSLGFRLAAQASAEQFCIESDGCFAVQISGPVF
jgi:hypothetical protein